ncbi:MAG: TetR/AcrR family transcriptional regulator [Phycisphaerae bacterium]|nr:TetR/AcrR family transcriptional regulator [Phycisphaerae bacterium]
MGRSIWSVASPPRQPTRERLIDASAMLFYEQGFHAIGIDQIIAEVGVTKTTFYNHFESKDDLIVAVLRDRDERDMRALDAELARRGGGPFDQILSVFDVLDDWFSDADFRGCLFINAAVQFPNLNDPVHVAASAHGENVRALFERLARAGGAPDPDALSRQLCMLVAAAIANRHGEGDMKAAAMAKDMASALLERVNQNPRA